jgi:hypothetical protein
MRRRRVQSLDGRHTLFGEVAEDDVGVLDKINGTIVDDDQRPLQNIRIRRTEVLDDPFPDPEGLDDLVPEASPEPAYEFGDRLEEDWQAVEDTRCGSLYAMRAAKRSGSIIVVFWMHFPYGVYNKQSSSWTCCLRMVVLDCCCGAQQHRRRYAT